MANFVDFVDQNGTHYALSDKALIRFNLCKAIDPYPHDTWDINYKNFEYNWGASSESCDKISAAAHRYCKRPRYR